MEDEYVRSRFHRFAAGFVLLLFVFSSFSCSSETTSPNIILIMSDDQGFGDFGFTGNAYVQTPKLDAFKEEAVYFDHFFVSPVCAPTRASLLTGRYHLGTGTTWVTHGQEVMDSEEYTLAESLREQGYQTACFGKWHNGEHYPNDPIGQGFDTFFGFKAGHWNSYFNPVLTYNNAEVQTSGYITDILTDSALNFMERNKDKPFFCYIPYNAPHGPFQVPDAYFDKYKKMGLDDKNAAVYGMCENIDDNVGRILDHLKKLGLEENSIVLYLTDNGPNGHRYNAGMKGIKAHVDEGGIRTPLLIRYPGKLPANDTLEGIASHIDLFPTLHALAGIPFREVRPIDGIDLSSYLLKDKDIPDRKIYTHQVNQELKAKPSSLRTKEYRLVLRGKDTLLYHMSNDPGQKLDISAKYPDLTKRLAKDLYAWYDSLTQRPYDRSIPVGYSEALVVSLPAPEAKLQGALQFKGGMGWANDWITGFNSEQSDIARWQIDVHEEANYQISVKMACKAPSQDDFISFDTGKEVLLYQLKHELDAPYLPNMDRVPRGEVNDRDWKETKLGKVFLQEGRSEVSFTFSGQKSTELEVLKLVLTKID